MERLLTLWQSLTTEQLVISLMILSNIGLWLKCGALAARYHLLNRLASNHAWIMRLKLGVTTIRHHRNGDFEIVEPLNDDP